MQETLSVLITANASKYNSELRKAAQDTKQYGQAVKEANAHATGAWKAAKDAALGHKQVGESAKSAAKHQKEVGSSAKNASLQFGALARSAATTASPLQMLAGNLTNVKNVLATLGILAVAVGLRSAAQAALEFDKNMRNVNSLSITSSTTFAESERNFRDLSKSAIDMSTKLPQSATVLSDGMYQIASSGFQGAEGLKVLESAAMGASAGLTTTNKSAAAITAVLNAYGMSADQAQRVSDALFQTVNLGVIEYADLATNIGQVVGIANAASISIEEVGASISVLTRVGATPDESITWLKNMITKLINPSESLASVYRQLGYESGVAALKQKGLNGVMQDLYKFTGGSIDLMQQLFPEIRASLGAVGMMTNEGKLATEMFEAMGTAEKNVGATQMVLSEQSKGVSYQLQMLRNAAMKPLLTAFATGAPIVAGFLKGLTAVFDWKPSRGVTAALDGLHDALEQVFQSIGAIARNLAPVAKLLAALGGGAVILALRMLGDGLEYAAEVAEDLRWVIDGLVVYIGTRFAMSALMSVQRIGFVAKALTGLGAVAQWLGPVLMGTTAAQQALGAAGVRASIGMTAATAATVAFRSALMALPLVAVASGAVFLANQLINAHREANELAKAFAKKTVAEYDTTQIDGLKNAAAAARREIEAADQQLRTLEAEKKRRQAEYTSTGADGGPAGMDPKIEKKLDAEKRKKKELESTVRSLDAATEKYDGNVRRLSVELGISEQQVTDLARTNKLDLTKSWEDSQDAINNVREKIKGLDAAYGLNAQEVKKLSLAQFEAMEANREEASKFVKDVSEAFKGATDVIAKFASDTKASYADIRKEYQDQLNAVRDFAKNMQTALRLGLDPRIAERLMKEGPEKAGPYLQRVIEQNAEGRIKEVNKFEEDLRKQNKVYEAMAQNLNVAVSGNMDKMSAEVLVKMAYMTGEVEGKGKEAALKMGSALKLSAEDTQKIIASYSNAVTAGVNVINEATDWSKVKVFDPRTADPNTYSTREGQGPKGNTNYVPNFAEGGFAHIASTAPGGKVIYAEPETGGEAYIPLSPAKRTRSEAILTKTADMFGMDVVPRFASGGFRLLPEPQLLVPGTWTQPTNNLMKSWYVQAREYEDARLDAYKKSADAMKASIVGDGNVGSGWQSITSYLSGKGIPYTVTSTTGGHHAKGSFHYAAKAVDLVSGNMRQIFEALLPVAGSLSELFFTPMGYSIKNGRRVPPIAAAQHYNHVHAATYDVGGALRPGWTMAYNGTGRTETVLTSKDVDRLVAALGTQNRGGNTIVVDGSISPKETARQIDRVLR